MRCGRWLAWQGSTGAAKDTHSNSGGDGEDAHGLLQLASLPNQVAFGLRAGKKVRRVRVPGGKQYTVSERCASFNGYHRYTHFALSASDLAGLERLCRYVLRPPLAQGRSTTPDALAAA